MIVVDASAAIELLMRGPLASRIGVRLFAASESLHAPYLIDVEVAQVLRRFARKADIGVVRASQAIDDLAAMPLTRYPHLPLLPRVWRLRENVSAYDACYLALAEALKAPLITCDPSLASIPGCQARIDVIV